MSRFTKWVKYEHKVRALLENGKTTPLPINKSTIENNELMIEINLENLEDVIQYLKSDDTCRFRQLIDIVGIDFPQE